jgi:hypothetical protein
LVWVVLITPTATTLISRSYAVTSLLDTARRQLAAALKEAEREVTRLRAAIEALAGDRGRRSAKSPMSTSAKPKPAAPTPAAAPKPASAVKPAKPKPKPASAVKPVSAAKPGAPEKATAAAKRAAPARRDNRQAVLAAVTANAGTNATKLAALTGLSMGTVRSRLTQLADEGLIRREGAGAKTGWHPREQ